MHTGTINRVCREITETPGVWLDIDAVHESLTDLAKADHDDAALGALRDACAYQFAPYGQGDTSGLSLGPMPLGGVDDEVLDMWSEHAGDPSLHPLVRAGWRIFSGYGSMIVRVCGSRSPSTRLSNWLGSRR